MELSCTVYESIIDAVDELPEEQLYPTLKAIICKKFGLPMDDYDFTNVNVGIYKLACEYKSGANE